MASDQDLFGRSVLDIWFSLEFVLVSTDEVGQFYLDIGQEDKGQ